MKNTDLQVFKSIINKDQFHNKFQVKEKKGTGTKEIVVFNTIFVFDYETEAFEFSFDMPPRY
ncbi:TPA: hypothetical protein LA742_001229 [Clostridium botulinum]|uniref:hypothetical protein n=1 Tax=Clostridium sporogenes TaxID=1509 RepID=UPI000774CB8F|nr:hypothetical protein [Clostridium sporogenes]AUM93714.1 hypothetical protein RSJ11_00420 [Clostridium sporogenes]HBJ2612796.1 hypothetical protein [Clostridium botulinum]